MAGVDLLMAFHLLVVITSEPWPIIPFHKYILFHAAGVPSVTRNSVDKNHLNSGRLLVRFCTYCQVIIGIVRPPVPYRRNRYSTAG